jgi:hypothetical protein
VISLGFRDPRRKYRVRQLQYRFRRTETPGTSSRICAKPVSNSFCSIAARSIFPPAANATPRTKCQGLIIMTAVDFGCGIARISSQRLNLASTSISYVLNPAVITSDISCPRVRIFSANASAAFRAFAKFASCIAAYAKKCRL